MQTCILDSMTFLLNDFKAWRADTTCISTSEQSASPSTIFSMPSIWPLIFRRRTTSARFSNPGRVCFMRIENLNRILPDVPIKFLFDATWAIGVYGSTFLSIVRGGGNKTNGMKKVALLTLLLLPCAALAVVPLVTDDADTVGFRSLQFNSGLQFSRTALARSYGCSVNPVLGVTARSELGVTFGYQWQNGGNKDIDGISDLIL